MSDLTPIDLRGYVDLALYDRDPGDLVERAVLDAQVKFPGWVPREGDTALVLIEGQALQVAELVYAINRLPGAVAEGLLRLQNLERDQGAVPTASALVTFSDDAGRTLPAGARLQLQLGDQQVLFTTDADATAAPASTTASVAITGSALTSIGNGTPSGTTLALLDQSFYVQAVELDADVTGGRDPEDSAAYLNRAVQRLARLTDTILLPDHFTAAALEQPGVARATTIDLYNAPGGTPGSNPGYVTVAVLGPGGVALSAGAKTAIHDNLRPLAADHLVIRVIDATVTPVNVNVTVDRDPNFTSLEVQDAVAARLEEYLSPDTWDFSGTVYRFELVSVIDNVPGVNRVVALTTPATDFALSGNAALASAGTITVVAP